MFFNIYVIQKRQDKVIHSQLSRILNHLSVGADGLTGHKFARV